MRNKQLSVLVSFIYVVLLWPSAQTRNTSPRVSTGDVTYAGDAFDPERPHVAKRSILSCDTSFDHYCLNNGQCMYIVDLNENHCKCEQGYLGSRCEQPQLVVKPMKQEELALIIVCVVLVILGLAGAIYFFCKWYRKKQPPQQQKRLRYTAVQIAYIYGRPLHPQTHHFN